MRQEERDNWRFSIEDAARQAADVVGHDGVGDVFAMFGASGIDDLPDHALEQVLSELTRLAAD